MAARIAPAVAGGMLLGPPGGAIGGGLGEAYAQYLEGKFNSKQIALATALGLIPGARFASIRGAVPRIALRAGEGATMGAGSQVASNVIEGQPVLENVPQAAGLGLALGGAGGGAERLLTNRAAARAGQGQRAQAAVAEGQLPPMSEQEFMLAKQASDIDLQHPTYTQQQGPYGEEDLLSTLSARTAESAKERYQRLNKFSAYREVEREHALNPYKPSFEEEQFYHFTGQEPPSILADVTGREIKPYWNEGQLKESFIDREFQKQYLRDMRTGIKNTDVLYPQGAPKLTAKDIETWIQHGTTDPVKLEQLIKGKLQQPPPPTVRSAEVGASLLGMNQPRGWWASLFSGRSSDSVVKAPNALVQTLQGLGKASSRMVHDLSPSGKSLVQDVTRVYDKYERELAQFLDGPQGVKHLAESKLKLTAAERANISDVMQGYAPAMNERVGQVVNIMRAQSSAIEQRATGFLEIHDVVTGKTIPWQPRQNYFPRYMDFDTVAKDPGRLANAVSEIHAQENAIRLKSGMAPIDRGEAERIFREMRRHSRMEYGHLEIARRWNLNDYERDGIKAWSKYVEGALKRLNESEVFGRQMEKALTKVSQVGAETSDDMAQYAAQRFIEQVTNRQLYGKGMPFNPAAGRVVGTIRSAQVGLKLGQAVLANMSQSNLTGIVAGYGNLYRGLQQLRTEGGQDFARMAGATIEQTLRDLVEGIGVGSFGSKVLSATGFTKVELFNRMLAANSGREFARDLVSKLAANPTGRGADVWKRHLQQMNIDPMEVMKQGFRLSPEQEISAARSIIERTQFKVRPQELPLYWQGPMGKLLTQFSSFGFKAMTALKDEVYMEAKRGNFTPLARFALITPIWGEAIAGAQSLLRGKEGERPDNMLKRLAEDYAAVGGLGLAYDAWRSAQYGEVGVLRRMAGPGAGDIAQIAAGILGNDPKMLQKLALQNIPVVGPTLRPYMFPPKRKE
jgi:hypothetical protein